VEGHSAARAHARTPDLPVLAASLRAVIPVDEDQVDRGTPPVAADILAAGDVPADLRPAAPGASPDREPGGDRVAVPSRAHCPSTLVSEGVNEVKLGVRGERVAENECR
jgi:hypothetical protein